MSFPLDFSALPTDLRRRLLLGFSGKLHLHGLAGVALSHSHQPGDLFSTIASDALLAAWGENPLDGNSVAALVGNMEKLPPLPPQLLPQVKAVLSHWKPAVTPEAQEAMAGDSSTQLAYLREQLRMSPRSLFWWQHLYEYSRINGDWQVMKEMIVSATPPQGLESLFTYVTANAMLASGDLLPAAGIYRQLQGAQSFPLVDERLAAAFARAGKMDKAMDTLRNCVQERPWHVGLWMRWFELAEEGAQQVATLPGKTMVLAYSWNKADDLAETLDSLFRSDLGDVHVRILDNGSTDGTPEIVRQFVDKFGSSRAASVTMPVNVGAPAARNWLMHLPEVRESDYAAYIDDDISLPKDWLLKLGAAAERYPDAGVWGCKVVDFDGPSRVQCGEHNLMPTAEERQQALMSTIMLQDGDFGQADYIRPCTSVTGCVHLFPTSRLLENGDFDLRFSPTQYDDLERDLRMVLGGGYAVYSGHVAIRHKRKSGSVSDVGKVESAGATANLHKLMAKYSTQEFEFMATAMDAVLLADLERKQGRLV